jgi:tetratricopeptide (TPR) repeat protein
MIGRRRSRWPGSWIGCHWRWAQVAGYCVQVGLSLAEYLDAYPRRRDELLAKGQPAGYPATVATTWQLSVDQLAGRSPAAVQLLRLAAFLAAERIPLSLLAADPQQLPDELAAAVQDEAALEATVGALVGLSLVARERGGLRLHRLVQAATQASLPANQAARWAERAVRLIGSAFPDQPEDPQSWPQTAGLLAHAVAAADYADTRQAAPEATGELRNQVGRYLLSRGEFAAAREQLERALRLKEEAYGPDHPQVARTLGNLGYVLAELRELPAAREQMERALHIEEATYGPDHREVAITLANLSRVLSELGESTAAREQLERALRIEEAAYGPDHLEVARTVYLLGILLRDLGDLPAAREQLERALEITEATLGADRPAIATLRRNLDCVVQELGDKKRRDAGQ